MRFHVLLPVASFCLSLFLLALVTAFPAPAFAQVITDSTSCQIMLGDDWEREACVACINGGGESWDNASWQCQGGPTAPLPSGSGSGSGSGGGLQNPLQADSLTELLDIILAAVVQLGAMVLVLALVWVGFLFVTAQGNDEKIKSARAALVWTVIGGLLLLGASAISAVIKATASQL